MSESELDVLIVGAGFGGMYMLHRLRKLGLRAVVVEAGSDVGGTWYWNRYPGARCDIESLQYSYQFDDALQQEWQWSERYSPQPEILTYARHVAERYDLHKDIRFNTRIRMARFDEAELVWSLEADNAASFVARHVVFATGCLSVPNWPQIPGLETFSGQTLHTALWPHDEVDLTGKKVAVIGTGSSAIQSIPLIARQASQLFVFQRTPNYSVPAHNAPLDREREKAFKADYANIRAIAKTTLPGIYGSYRQQSALEVSPQERREELERRWQEGGLIFMGAFNDLIVSKAANDTVAEFVRDKIREVVDDPDTAAKLCPDNIIGGKRLCVDSDYYATFNRANVTLIDLRQEAMQRISETAVHAGDKRYDVDVLIVATGFDAMTGALTNIDIRGRGQASLSERWSAGPSSYLGLAMADFPNLFTVTGPGSPSVFTNMLPTIEQHVEWIADCLAHMQRAGHRMIEAQHDAEHAWWAHTQEVAAKTIKGSTNSWYMGANVAGKARVFMPYFGGFPAYCEKCKHVVANGYEGFAFA